MRVIETVKTSQCQGCGRPPLRCRCDLISFKRQKNKCVFNQVTRFVAKTEKLAAELRDALSPQITIKDASQEATTHDDTLLVKNDITCPRCIWKLKQSQQSEDTRTITDYLCEHCQLRALIKRLKEEKLKTARDKQTHNKLEFGKKQVHLSKSKPPSDEQEVNIINQINKKFPDKRYEFKYSSSEINVLRTESAFSLRITTENRSYSETHLLKLKNEAHLPRKTSEQKEIVWDTALDVVGLNKALAFRSTSTMSYLNSKEIKMKVRSDYLRAQPGSSEVSKKEMYIEKVKEEILASSKPEKMSDQNIMNYYFPTCAKSESMVKHVSSSELIRDTQEKLKKSEEKKQKVQELLRIQRIESINKRHERELRKIAEETERQRRENSKIVEEEERNKLVVKYSEVNKDIKDTMFKLKDRTHGPDRKDLDKRKKTEDEIAKLLEEERVKQKLTKDELVNKRADSDITTKKKHEAKKIDEHKKKVDETKTKLKTQHVIKRERDDRVIKSDVAEKINKQENEKIVQDNKGKFNSQAVEPASKKGDSDAASKRSDERTKTGSLKFETEAHTMISKSKDETKKQEGKDRLRAKGATMISRPDSDKKKEKDHELDQERRTMADKQTSTDEAAEKKREVDKAAEKKREEENMDEIKKKENEVKRKPKEQQISDEGIKEEKSKADKEMKNIISPLKGETKKQVGERSHRAQEQQGIFEKQYTDEATIKKQGVDESKEHEDEQAKMKKEEEKARQKKEKDDTLQKKQEEDERLKHKKRENEDAMLKMMSKLKEYEKTKKVDEKKQKEEERMRVKDLKTNEVKQAAEEAGKKKREAAEAVIKKTEKEKADASKTKEEDVAKTKKDDESKKQQEERERLEREKLKHEKELQNMMLKLKEHTKKVNEEDRIRDKEQKASLERVPARDNARQKRDADEAAKKKLEEEKAEKTKRQEEIANEKRKKEDDSKKELDGKLKQKEEEEKKIKEERRQNEQRLLKIISKFKDDTTKQKEEERIKNQELKASSEKQAAENMARLKRAADETAKKKREIEEAEKKNIEKATADENRRKEDEKAKKKQEEADDLLRKKQDEENKIKEDKRKYEETVKKMIFQFKDDTKKQKEQERIEAQQQKVLIEKQAAQEAAKQKRNAEEAAKMKRDKEAVDKKKELQEVKDNQRLAKEEEARVQHELIEKEKQKRAKAEAEKQKQRALEQNIRDIIAKEKYIKEEQKKRELELENEAKKVMLKQQAAVEVAKSKLEKQNAATEKALKHIPVEDILEYTSNAIPSTVPKPVNQNIVIGENILQFKPPLPPDPLLQEPPEAVIPMLFKKKTYLLEATLEDKLKHIEEVDKKDIQSTKRSTVPEPIADDGGVIRYALSDRSFIDKGWTVLPIEKVVRKMNVYRMRPAQPEFNWFEHNKKKRLLMYETGERLAEFDDRGQCHWYYRNGRLALDYYEAEELNAQQRFVVYSNGEPDERGRARPFTVLATFDFLGSGVVFDHGGKIRLTYNQTEGVVLDRHIGPATTWKWHSLNDPPVLQQVMIDTKLAHKDPTILSLGDKTKAKPQQRNDAQMVAIEFENFIKDKKKKLTQKFKPFQIKMKALKINENFSLKILDQATIYLIFREGSANIKLNIGMLLDHKEIIDTDTADLGVVANTVQRFPAATDSIAAMQRSVEHAQRFERNRTERERVLHPLPPGDSAERLVAGLSKPLKPTPKAVPPSPPEVASKSNVEDCKCSRKPSSNIYYNSRLS